MPTGQRDSVRVPRIDPVCAVRTILFFPKRRVSFQIIHNETGRIKCGSTMPDAQPTKTILSNGSSRPTRWITLTAVRGQRFFAVETIVSISGFSHAWIMFKRHRLQATSRQITDRTVNVTIAPVVGDFSFSCSAAMSKSSSVIRTIMVISLKSNYKPRS